MKKNNNKRITTIYLSNEVIDFFKEKAVDNSIPYQTLLNSVLLEYVKERKSDTVQSIK